MGKINNFDVLKLMGERNLDIKGFPIFDNLAEVNDTKRGGKITLWIDKESAQRILQQTMTTKADKPVIGILLIADQEQFYQLKKELEDDCKDGHNPL